MPVRGRSTTANRHIRCLNAIRHERRAAGRAIVCAAQIGDDPNRKFVADGANCSAKSHGISVLSGYSQCIEANERLHFGLSGRGVWYLIGFSAPEDKRMASGLTRNQVPGNRLRVRIPCPPLLNLAVDVTRWRLFFL